MFILNPGGSLQARLEVNAARAFDLQIGIRSRGAPSYLGRWRRPGEAGHPFSVEIPPLDDDDRLLIALHLIGEERSGLLDVNLGLMHEGRLLRGSEFRMLDHAYSRLAGMYLDFGRHGDRLELVGSSRETAPLDERSWRRSQPVRSLVVPVLAPMEGPGFRVPAPAEGARIGLTDRWVEEARRKLLDLHGGGVSRPGAAASPLPPPSVGIPAPSAVTAPGASAAAEAEPEAPPPADPASPDPSPPPPQAAKAGELPADAGSPERRINVWMAERESAPNTPLVLGERYTLCINVGMPVTASLASGPEAVVPDDDIPQAGLETEWVVHSHAAELLPLSPEVQVTRHQGGGVPSWTARFSLRVPRGEDSETVRVGCIPLAAEEARLQTLVYGRSPVHSERAELYRELDIDLWVVEGRMRSRRGAAEASAAAVRLVDEVTHSPTGHLNLVTTHEWTTPRNLLSVTVLGPGSAYARGGVGILAIDQDTGWDAVQTTVGGLITNLRGALERFRGRHEAYLDAVELGDLEGQLARQDAGADFFGGGEPPSPASQAAWDAVSRSPELRELALEGRTLYDAFFPPGTELRGWIDQLQQYDRLDLNCQPRAGAAYVPHVPWGLMYRLDPPAPGQPLDPRGFLGLALRLGYNAHRIPVPSKALGRVEEVHRAFFLYWGEQARDPTAVEALWQRSRWASSPNHVVVPDPSDAAPHKQRLLTLLDAPVPVPTRLLYLYCQCNTGQGNDPVLRFGENSQPENVVRRVELGATELVERPLVFANACTTSSADPFMANELEASFFRRGVRAYLGTEGKVPIGLASRFAAVFFHYFDRKASPPPMAAGEAAFQAKLFLWRHYLNLGGLFYTYVNQYELYMADDAEVRTLQP